jgi:hypothetical protein
MPMGSPEKPTHLHREEYGLGNDGELRHISIGRSRD